MISDDPTPAGQIPDATRPDRGVTAAGRADLEAVVDIYCRAFPTSMGVALGSRYHRSFFDRYLDRPNRVFLVARSGDRVDGFAVARPASEVTGDDRALALTAAGGMVTHPKVFLRSDVRGEVIRRLRGLGTSSPPAPDLPTPVLSLPAIGVDPDVRKRGCGRALMEAMFAESQLRGYSTVRLTTYRENDAAVRLWEQLGGKPLEHPTNPAVQYWYWTPAAA